MLVCSASNTASIIFTAAAQAFSLHLFSCQVQEGATISPRLLLHRMIKLTRHRKRSSMGSPAKVTLCSLPIITRSPGWIDFCHLQYEKRGYCKRQKLGVEAWERGQSFIWSGCYWVGIMYSKPCHDLAAWYQQLYGFGFYPLMQRTFMQPQTDGATCYRYSMAVWMLHGLYSTAWTWAVQP